MSSNVAASVKARLLNKAKEREEQLELLLVRYACERFLYRLGASRLRERCTLKGAGLLTLWMEEPYATRDVDLLGSGPSDETTVRGMMATIGRVPCPEDGLVFDLTTLSVEPIRDEQKYAGHRAIMRLYLGKARIRLQVDFGFSDALSVAPEEATLPTLIDRVPPPVVLTYPRVVTIAEKFEAMVQLGRGNSRMKDFHDLWALSEEFAFEGESLRDAVSRCFARRGTPWTSTVPDAMTPAFYADPDVERRWRSYIRRGQFRRSPPEIMNEIGDRVRTFLGPVRESILTDSGFDQHWPASGPWLPGMHARSGGTATSAEIEFEQASLRRFRPYPEYKSSGVEWLGEIPAHWECKALKRTLRVVNGSTPKSGGHLAIAGTPVCTNQGCRSLVLRQPCNEAYFYFELHVARPVFEAADRGSTFRELAKADLESIALSVPPQDEQRAVAAFLDRETTKIDGLVARKERLIELLQEKRSAIITRAVTRGLDPNVPTKDSGVEWLGKIPAHWRVKRLWHLTPSDRRIMYGIVLPGPNVDDGVPIVKGGDVAASRLKLESLSKTTYEIESRYVRSRLRRGDLVYAIRGSIGEVEMVPGELDGANLTQDAARVAYAQTTNGRWLMYALRSKGVFSQLEAGALGATIKEINIRDLKRALVPVPPRGEQGHIANYLDAETARFDVLSAKIREAVDRLKEFRTALIFAAVTGKIDVRGKAS